MEDKGYKVNQTADGDCIRLETKIFWKKWNVSMIWKDAHDFNRQERGGKAESRVHGRSRGCRTWDPRDKNNETTESSGWWTTLRIEVGIYFPQGVARGLRKTEGNEEIAVINTYHLRALGRSRKHTWPWHSACSERHSQTGQGTGNICATLTCLNPLSP